MRTQRIPPVTQFRFLLSPSRLFYYFIFFAIWLRSNWLRYFHRTADNHLIFYIYHSDDSIYMLFSSQLYFYLLHFVLLVLFPFHPLIPFQSIRFGAMPCHAIRCHAIHFSFAFCFGVLSLDFILFLWLYFICKIGIIQLLNLNGTQRAYWSTVTLTMNCIITGSCHSRNGYYLVNIETTKCTQCNASDENRWIERWQDEIRIKKQRNETKQNKTQNRRKL